MSKWYEESFGEDYLLIYKHRSYADAFFQVEQIIKWLQLKRHDHILDLCCGRGRHSIALASHEFHVVGLDLSKTLLKLAIKDTDKRPVPFIYGDMRVLPFIEESFEVVLNLFTSFGYFRQDEDNQQVLKEIARVLKPKGRFLIDFINQGYVKEALVPFNERIEKGILIQEKRWIEENVIYKTIVVKSDKGERFYQERVKMYTLEEMQAKLHIADLDLEQIYGNFYEEPYQPASERMILIGRLKE